MRARRIVWMYRNDNANIERFMDDLIRQIGRLLWSTMVVLTCFGAVILLVLISPLLVVYHLERKLRLRWSVTSRYSHHGDHEESGLAPHYRESVRLTHQ